MVEKIGILHPFHGHAVVHVRVLLVSQDQVPVIGKRHHPDAARILGNLILDQHLNRLAGLRMHRLLSRVAHFSRVIPNPNLNDQSAANAKRIRGLGVRGRHIVARIVGRSGPGPGTNRLLLPLLAQHRVNLVRLHNAVHTKLGLHVLNRHRIDVHHVRHIVESFIVPRGRNKRERIQRNRAALPGIRIKDRLLDSYAVHFLVENRLGQGELLLFPGVPDPHLLGQNPVRLVLDPVGSHDLGYRRPGRNIGHSASDVGMKQPNRQA